MVKIGQWEWKMLKKQSKPLTGWFGLKERLRRDAVVEEGRIKAFVGGREDSLYVSVAPVRP